MRKEKNRAEELQSPKNKKVFFSGIQRYSNCFRNIVHLCGFALDAVLDYWAAALSRVAGET